MRTDDAQASAEHRFAPELESDDRGGCPHNVILTAGTQFPAVYFLKAGEAGCLQSFLNRADGMPRAGAGIDEIKKILGGLLVIEWHAGLKVEKRDGRGV
jgi:hypothetical protein